MNIKSLFVIGCLLTLSIRLTAQIHLEQSFNNLQEEAKPWTFWYWMFGAVSAEGITADLEAMKEAGLGGAYLMPIKSINEGSQYQGKAQQLSPEWWKLSSLTEILSMTL